MAALPRRLEKSECLHLTGNFFQVKDQNISPKSICREFNHSGYSKPQQKTVPLPSAIANDVF
jgi:hypothetical protein